MTGVPLAPLLDREFYDSRAGLAGRSPQLGIVEIPVMVAAGWSEAQKRAYVLADNQLAITGSGWDPELLRLELGELNLAGFDLSLTGFGDLELKGSAGRADRGAAGFGTEDQPLQLARHMATWIAHQTGE